MKMYKVKKLTRFERARIIGSRALQISMGAPVLGKVSDEIKDPTKIAVQEFKQKVVPMTVVRRAEGKESIIININEIDLEEKLF